ncbi:hypothetical protein F2P56_031119 [Juglans regia]|uniref:Uncharacterized protein n=2 Tax=Juglans regia TaxID=51240 RepID=A0A833TR27_JUGRE|nr:uncharacterized protein LOC109013162 [Juglans regia]KAF5450797.1 hypothetical protein F2P56_031119 [Juglans regia]
MGNEYNRFHHHQRLHLHSRTTFLPILCSRTSMKDVAILPKWEDRSVSSDDPLSPKIGCMGQVKRNNRVVGFPSSQKLTLTTKHNANGSSSSSSDDSVKYSKLKKLFSCKNLAATTAAATIVTAPATTVRCRSRRRVNMSGASGLKSNHSSEKCVSISIVDLDPPLPVIKRVQKPQGEEVDNLWKRRSGGVALKTLQLRQIHHPKRHLQPTTV